MNKSYCQQHLSCDSSIERTQIICKQSNWQLTSLLKKTTQTSLVTSEQMRNVSLVSILTHVIVGHFSQIWYLFLDAHNHNRESFVCTHFPEIETYPVPSILQLRTLWWRKRSENSTYDEKDVWCPVHQIASAACWYLSRTLSQINWVEIYHLFSRVVSIGKENITLTPLLDISFYNKGLFKIT